MYTRYGSYGGSERERESHFQDSQTCSAQLFELLFEREMLKKCLSPLFHDHKFQLPLGKKRTILFKSTHLPTTLCLAKMPAASQKLTTRASNARKHPGVIDQ